MKANGLAKGSWPVKKELISSLSGTFRLSSALSASSSLATFLLRSITSRSRLTAHRPPDSTPTDDSAPGASTTSPWLLRSGLPLQFRFRCPSYSALVAPHKWVVEGGPTCQTKELDEATFFNFGLVRVLVRARFLKIHPRSGPFLARFDRSTKQF